jgi:hypothetical protein
VFLFLIALFLPMEMWIGSLRLSPYRVVLLAMVLPCLGMWMAGKAGRIRTADIVLLFFCVWCTLSLIVIHGLAFSVEPSGMLWIETFGSYLLARCYIQDGDDFYNAIQLLFRIVAILFPFAVFELVTGRDISYDLFAAILPMAPFSNMPPRWGLARVQSVFDHPILFGVCTGSIFALVHQVLGYRESFFQRSLKIGIVGATSFMSLSAGPITALVSQGLLLLWNWVLGATQLRWKILIGLVLVAVLTIELSANRSLPEIFIGYFSFDTESAWYRIVIWRYGTASIMRHPFFGTGMNEWEHPAFVSFSSIDMFWLIHGIQHGLPAALLMLMAFFSICLGVSFRKGLDDKLIQYRTGFLISMTGLFLVGWTVDFWTSAYAFVLFLMGSGVWMLDREPKEKTALRTKSIGVVRPDPPASGRSIRSHRRDLHRGKLRMT